MAYYVRPDSSAGRYIRTDAPEGRYFAHSAEGSTWAKGHKYIDKRLINGVWKYLYEVPKAYVTEGRDSAKTKASEAKKDVSEGAKATKENVSTAAKTAKANVEKKVEDTKKAAKDFKDYSRNIDSKVDRYEESLKQREDREKERLQSKKENKEIKRKSDEGFDKAWEELYKRNKELDDVEAIYGKNSEQYKYQYERTEEAYKDAAEYAKDSEEARKKLNNMGNAERREVSKAREEREKLEEAKKEQETNMYKASKALNDVIDGTTGATKQAAQWLKNQLNSGADWTTDQIEKIRESDAVASLAGKLENLYANANSGATKKGLSILSQIIGWGKLDTKKK